MRNNKGFTLIELLIVVVIIGILAAIAVPKFQTTKGKAYYASMKSDLHNLTTAQEAFFYDSTKYSASLAALNNFATSSGVSLVVTAAPGGWNAIASHAQTARRSFEVAYWKTIVSLAEGTLLNKNNADCVEDKASAAVRVHDGRDLEPLGDYLLARHTRAVADADMVGRALVGELPFRWESPFDYPWMSGWRNNQDGTAHERNLLVVIPGCDRGRAVVMADHYDTAYMEDFYDKKQGGAGARLAAPGANQLLPFAVIVRRRVIAFGVLGTILLRDANHA
jgi:prepilin-type N-terminal cleavage/methylation domain-containing protein